MTAITNHIVRTACILTLLFLSVWCRGQAVPATRAYSNQLAPIASPKSLLADHPEFVEPVREQRRFEAEPLIEDQGADLDVRAWRFSYNARGIIEMPNHLRAAQTAVIVVHPWGIDDGQGWNTPEPAGTADFCTPEKNHLAARHTREVIDPFLKAMRPKVGFVMYSLPGVEDPIRGNLYRSFNHRPTAADRREGAKQMQARLADFSYRAQGVAARLEISRDKPVADYFRQFPGIDAGPRFDNDGFWNLPIPLTRDIHADADDVMIYDGAGYAALRNFLQAHKTRHVLLAGYATDMCYQKTTAGFDNLSNDFDVFLVGDATLATFPANDDPRYATNAAICYASLNHLITQVSWIKPTANAGTR